MHRSDLPKTKLNNFRYNRGGIIVEVVLVVSLFAAGLVYFLGDSLNRYSDAVAHHQLGDQYKKPAKTSFTSKVKSIASGLSNEITLEPTLKLDSGRTLITEKLLNDQ